MEDFYDANAGRSHKSLLCWCRRCSLSIPTHILSLPFLPSHTEGPSLSVCGSIMVHPPWLLEKCKWCSAGVCMGEGQVRDTNRIWKIEVYERRRPKMYLWGSELFNPHVISISSITFLYSIQAAEHVNTNLLWELVDELQHSTRCCCLFVAAAELLCLLPSAGGGGWCAVRKRGGLEEHPRHTEPDQPHRCAETWPSTSAVHGKVAALLSHDTTIGSVGLQEGLKRRKHSRNTQGAVEAKDENVSGSFKCNGTDVRYFMQNPTPTVLDLRFTKGESQFSLRYRGKAIHWKG